MRQYGFEPVMVGPSPLRRAKRAEQEGARKRWNDDYTRQTATRLHATILALKREIANLTISIDSELTFAAVRDERSVSSLESVRVMQSRRENLITTIARLSEKYASMGGADN